MTSYAREGNLSETGLLGIFSIYSGGGGGGRGGGSACLKEVPFSGWRYIKG